MSGKIKLRADTADNLFDLGFGAHQLIDQVLPERLARAAAGFACFLGFALEFIDWRAREWR